MSNPATYGILCAVITAFVLGAYPPASRGVYAHGGDVMFVLVGVAWARFLSMGAYCLFTHKKLFHSQTDLKHAISGGFFQFLTSVGIFGSLIYLSGPIMAIIVYTYAIMLLFYTIYRGETRMDLTTVGTTLLAFGGLTMVLGVWHSGFDLNWKGVALALIAAIANASRIYVFGKQTRQRNPIAVGAECYAFTAIFATLAMLYKMPQLPQDILGYQWMAVACVTISLASFGMFYGISLLGAFRWGLFSKIEPIFTSLFSVLFLGEILKWYQYLGILVVIASLVLFQFIDQRQRAVVKTSS